MTVQQTLGGAWVDDFGPGLDSINISGTTGWRANSSTRSNALVTGVDQFAKLKRATFGAWHERRNLAVKAGNDPMLVTLQFVDALNSTCDYVVPMSFTLRRSKSRPLLAQFNIAMLVYKNDKYNAPTPSSPDGLTGLLASIKNLISAVKNVVNFVKGIVNQVTAFIQSVTSIFQSVTNLIANAQSIPLSLLGAAKECAQAGTVMFASIANASGMTTAQSAAAMATGAEFSNIWCLLHNAVNKQQTYPDYKPLYGASNCSSTNGGSPASPYANTNPFYAIVGAPQNAPAPAASASTAPVLPTSTVLPPAVTITPAAKQSLAIINNSDPVLAPISMANLGVAAAAIASGVIVK